MKHQGGCHCGKVRYEVEMDLKKAISCNCSICMKRGSLLDFTPASRFTLLSDENDLTDYQFNKKEIHHLFCSTCGILSFGKGSLPDGTKMIAVNVRCLDGFNPDEIIIEAVNGKEF